VHLAQAANYDFGRSLGPGYLSAARSQWRYEVHTQQERRLLVRNEVLSLMQLPDEKVQQLINTRQLLAILIGGEERFDSKDLYQLIDSYKATASRRIH
jgi:hypothetical protein